MSSQPQENPDISDDDILITSDITSPASSNSGDEVSCTSSGPPPITLVNAKNYITLTEGAFAQLSPDELGIAVDQCKELVLESAEQSEERKWLVRRLIELRYQLQEAIENEPTEADIAQQVPETRVILGHHLTLNTNSSSTATRVCDRCSRNIWCVVQSWYQCTDCQYKCHVTCIMYTTRVCPHLKVSEDKKFVEDICPEVGLDAQGYLCAECKVHICYVFRRRSQCITSPVTALKGCIMTRTLVVAQEPRQCDYNGLYYCAACHWNNKIVVPARVLHNWDFEPRLVSRAAFQLLRAERNQPIIQINSTLIGFVEELSVMQKIREDMIQMKQYLIQCKDALEQNLPWRLVKAKHYLLKDTNHYSLQDLIDIKNLTLITKLQMIRSKMEKHIKGDCKVCSSQGYVCELCTDKDVFYPFDSFAYSCSKCNWVYHKSCWVAVAKQTCQRCVRIQLRKLKHSFEDEEQEYLENRDIGDRVT